MMSSTTMALLCLANQDTPGKTPGELMQLANDIHEANNEIGLKPFAPVDIVFASFVGYLLTDATDRERDLVFISENLSKVWTMLHVNVQILKNQLSDHDEQLIVATYLALKNQGIEDLLLTDLSYKTRQRLFRWHKRWTSTPEAV